MLYSNKRYDISEQILRTILRSNNQNQVESRREKKKLEQESIISKVDVEDPRKAELENEKKEAKLVEAEEERKKLIQQRELKKLNASEIARKIIEKREAKIKKKEEEKKKKIEDRKAELDYKNKSKDSTFTNN